MRRVSSCLAVLLMLVTSATARADIPVFPQRPDWDDTPVPMPEEIAIIAVGMAIAALVYIVPMLIGKWRERA